MRSLVDDERNYLVVPPIRGELEETRTTACSVGSAKRASRRPPVRSARDSSGRLI